MQLWKKEWISLKLLGITVGDLAVSGKSSDSTAGPLIKLIQTYQPIVSSSHVPKRFIIHKCVTIRHALSGERMGVDCLSIDGFECECSFEDVSHLQVLAIRERMISGDSSW